LNRIGKNRTGVEQQNAKSQAKESEDPFQHRILRLLNKNKGA